MTAAIDEPTPTPTPVEERLGTTKTRRTPPVPKTEARLAEAATKDGAGGPTGADGSGRRRTALPWALAILGLIGTLAFGLAWRSARNNAGAGGTATAESGATAELLASATAFSEDLTNFDGATIGDDFDKITARSTGEFRAQADQFFSTEIHAQLKEAQASSRGDIRSAFVQDAEDDRGTVFVVIDQTIANNQSPQPQADTLRMELSLILEDDAWLVERVSVLTAPSGGSTLPGVGEGTTETTAGN